MSNQEPPSIDEFFPETKRVRNPFVPIGALITAGVLTAGLISFRQGNSRLGQKLMRARVVVQGATVALMVGTASYYGALITAGVLTAGLISFRQGNSHELLCVQLAFQLIASSLKEEGLKMIYGVSTSLFSVLGGFLSQKERFF